MSWIEVLGLLGTVFIFASFFFNDSKWIRIGNMIGSALFVAYGLLMGTLSVWLLNGACIILNIVKLIVQHSAVKKERNSR